MTLLVSDADIAAAIEWVAFYRPLFEVVVLILLSATTGFLCARWMYRAKIKTRVDMLRVSQTRARRRLSQNTAAAGEVTRDRDSLRRRVKSTQSRGPKSLMSQTQPTN
jgi:hypothetical protein